MEDKIKFIEEICGVKLYPYQKDILRKLDNRTYSFKNGSKIQAIPTNDTIRGKRRHIPLLENGYIFNEIPEETHKIHNDIFNNDMYRFKKLVNLDDWAAGSNGKGLIVEGRISCITSRGINIDYQQTTLFVKWKNVYYIEKNR